ncbi:MAG: leucine-rich repeat protein [Clostridiales bacterium]|nr:leucine-rich repeat protein [Clostridiales bacterium]
MQYNLNRSKKVILLVLIGTFMLSLFLATFPVLLGGQWHNSQLDFDTYCKQLIEINENYSNENRIIVFSKRNIEDKNCIASVSGYGDMYVFQYDNNAQAQKALTYYNSLKYVESAMPDSVLKTQQETAEMDEDVLVLDHLTWGAEILGVDSYQDAIMQKYGSNENIPDVYVAVLDSGIDTDNEFLQGRIAYEYGKSFYRSQLYINGKSQYDFEDDHMHGTHVAGTIVDLTPDNVKIIPIKAVDSSGSGDISDIMMGIKYIMDLKEQKGLNIVAMNMSLAADSTGKESTLYFDEAFKDNIMSVVAAGNESYYAEEYFPANCPSALTVSALSQNAVYENFPFVSYYSNYGSNVDLCLPGTNVLSCVPDGYNYSKDYLISTTGGTYAYLSGTSMATPHATALVALYATYLGDGYDAAKVEKLIKSNTYDLGATGRDNLFGYGVPSMDLALADVELTTTPTLTFGEVGTPYHFDGTISVGITNNNPDYKGMDYKVYYTLDGSYPMICGNRYEYTGEIRLNESTHLSFVIYLFDESGFVKGHSQLYEIEYFSGEDEDKNTNGTGFEINRNGILERYTSGLQDVVIPEYVDGILVRELGNNLFYGLNIRSIVCEADVSLGNKNAANLQYPIRYCPNLESVTLGSRDATYAVSHCFNLKELILLNATSISAGGFPSFTLGYSYLGSYTAYGCSGIERVVAYHATYVGNYAFNYVKTLKELVLPEVNSIASNAFIECTSLTELDLPSVMYIYDNAFMDCYNLQVVYSPKLTWIESYAFANCISLTDIQTETVTKYGTGALYNCIGLTSLDTHAAQTIASGAFERCSNLTWLDLSSVTSIGDNTMPYCTNLKAIYCGSNKYLIDKSVNWADWIRRFGNLQYLVVDYGYINRGGLLGNYFFTCKVIDNKYRIYTKTDLFTAVFQDEDGNVIAKRYHVNADPLNLPTGEVYEEYQIRYLNWESKNTGQTVNIDELYYLTADDIFTLAERDVYYYAYAQQAKQYYATLYKLCVGQLPSESDTVYRDIDEACTVNNATVDVSDKSAVIKNINSIIDKAVGNLLDGLLLETDTLAVKEIVNSAKIEVGVACSNANSIVNLDDIIEYTLNLIAEQRLKDIASAKAEAKKLLRERTKDIYDCLSDTRKNWTDELYQKFESQIDEADSSEFEAIISACSKEIVIHNGVWQIEDLAQEYEDEQVREIKNAAQGSVRSLADTDLNEEELINEINSIIARAKSDIDEYLSSQEGPVEPEPEHQHELTYVEAVNSTCTDAGHTAYYTCNGCDKWFEDNEGEKEIIDHNSVETSLAAHDYADVEWSTSADGHWHVCNVCSQSSEKVSHNFADKQDKSHHWKQCSICDYETPKNDHDSEGEQGSCSICGYKDTESKPEPEPKPEPDVPKPNYPTEPNPTEGEPDDGTQYGDRDIGLVIVIGLSVTVLAIIAVVVAITIIRKRKKTN